MALVPKLSAATAIFLLISSQQGLHAQTAAGVHWSGARVEASRDLTPFGLKWISIGNRRADCKVLADVSSNKPLLNPYSGDAYAVEGSRGCPEALAGGNKVVAFPQYFVRDQGVRFYAPWGRIFVFRRYPAVEGWGQDQKFAFKWVSPEDF